MVSYATNSSQATAFLTRVTLKLRVVVKLHAVMSINFVQIKGEYLSCFFVLSFEKWSEQRKKIALSLPHSFAFSCLLRDFWAFIHVFVMKLYSFHLAKVASTTLNYETPTHVRRQQLFSYTLC